MDGADVNVTKKYLKEQLDVLGIKNLTEKELDKYTEGTMPCYNARQRNYWTNLIEFTALLHERRNREDANSDVSNLSSTSSLSISTLSSDQSKVDVAVYSIDFSNGSLDQTPDITEVTYTPGTLGRRTPAVFKVILLTCHTMLK